MFRTIRAVYPVKQDRKHINNMALGAPKIVPNGPDMGWNIVFLLGQHQCHLRVVVRVGVRRWCLLVIGLRLRGIFTSL